MSIPTLQESGELPPGEHVATLHEIQQAYGLANDRRRLLMRGLLDAAQNLSLSGVKRIWINGSFVTDKELPNDIDGCWEYNDHVQINLLDPVFLGSRSTMQSKYGLDFFISNLVEGRSGMPFPQFFQMSRNGNRKGIILVELGGAS